MRNSPEYMRARELANAKPIEIPHVRFYRPSNPQDLEDLESALLRALPRGKRLFSADSRQPDAIRKTAVESGILLDTLPDQLMDIAKAKRPRGHFERHPGVLTRYLEKYDTPELSMVAQFSWIKGEGEFAVVADKNAHRATTHSRNKKLIADDVQEIFRQIIVGDAGMGVGTSLGNGQYKAGIEKFKVADGGKINLHDFNRLPGASVRKIGMNHAVHWTQMAYEANPHLDIQCIPQNLGNGENGTFPIDEFLDGVDIVFEEVDNLLAKIAIREAARDRGIPVIMATDVHMGTIIDFQPGRQDAEIFPTLRRENVSLLRAGESVDFAQITDMAVEIVGEEARYWREGVDEGLSFWPQTGASAAASEVGIVKTLVRWARGEEIPPRTAYLLDAA
jgi:hypothetical protein